MCLKIQLRQITYIIFTILGVLISSCSSKSVDKKNPFSVGEYIYNAFSEGDSSLIWSIFDFENEDFYGRKFREAIRDEEIKNFILKNSKTQLLKIDTSSFSDLKFIEVYLEKDRDIFQITSGYSVDSLNNIKIKDYNITNYTKSCVQYNNSPYVPLRQLRVKKFIYNLNGNDLTIKNGAIEFENNTEYNMEEISFRLKIFKINNIFSQEIIFNQTIDINKVIKKGDLARLIIPQLNSYFVGEPLSRDKIGFDVEFLSVLPKPESHFCQVVRELTDKN